MKKFNIQTLKAYMLRCDIINSDNLIDSNTLLDSLDIDSLDGAMLFMEIEKDYQINLPFSIYSEVTIGDLVENINQVLINEIVPNAQSQKNKSK